MTEQIDSFCRLTFRTLDWTQCPALERKPGKIGGVWLFKGNGVPVEALFENLETGACITEFLE